jgi:NTE family protein
MNHNSLSKIRGLAAEGGGVLGIGHVGALEVLEQKGVPLQKLEYIVGASAGSIIAAALACRASVSYIKDQLLNTDFSKFKDSSWNYCADICGLVQKYGWYYGNALEKWIAQIMQDLTGNSEITLAEVKERYHAHLIVVVTQVGSTGCRTLYVDYKNDPTLTVHEAVRRSASIPLFYRAIFGTAGEVYMDGGLLDNYPIDVLYRYLHPDEVIGLKLISTSELSEVGTARHRTLRKATLTPPANVLEAMVSIISALRNQALKYHIRTADSARTVKIDVGTLSPIDFELSKEDSQWLLDQGRTGASAWVNNLLDK